MWLRLGVAALIALVVALPVSIGLATLTDYSVGRADLTGSGVSGAAVVRRQQQLGQTHVMLHLEGTLNKTVIWRIEGGAWCGSPSTSTLMTKTGSSTSSKIGTVSSVDLMPSTLTVTSTSAMLTFRVYDYTTGKIGPELACGKLINQPNTGSEHWW